MHADFDGENFPVEQKLVLCTQPRVGSTFLSSLLRHALDAGLPHEYYHARVAAPILGKRWGLLGDDMRLDLDLYTQKLMANRTTANGVFGVKMHWNQAAPLINGGVFWTQFKDSFFVFLTRDDSLGQAISLALSLQTNAWKSSKLTDAAPTYSRAQIAQALNFIVSERAHWEIFFATFGITPLRVTYEHLTAHRRSVIEDIADRLGLPIIDQSALDNPGFKKMPEGVKGEWRERFLAESHG